MSDDNGNNSYNIHSLIYFMKWYAINEKKLCMYVDVYNNKGESINHEKLRDILKDTGIDLDDSVYDFILHEEQFIISFDSYDSMEKMYNKICKVNHYNNISLYLLVCDEHGELIKENVGV